MNELEFLTGALHYYNIEIISVNGTRITVGRGYEIELEANGIYKLLSNNQVVAPFNDVNELCQFILL